MLVLALVGMNACYPGDYECADNAEVFSEVVKVVKDSNQDAPFGQSSQANSSENDTHYCLCSLSCHTMFLSYSSFKNLSYIVLNFSLAFKFNSLTFIFT